MELTDLQIVAGIRQKNTDTYQYIINRYGKQVYYLAYSIMHVACSVQDMEECAADVFFRAWTDIERFDPEKGSFRTWLFILTKYRALEYKRRISRQRTVNIDELLIEDPEDIERRIVSRQDQERVIGCINGFAALDRELFIRRYFYNEKINDLMDSLSLTRPAIDNRLLRGRKLIKEALAYD